VITDQLGH